MKEFGRKLEDLMRKIRKLPSINKEEIMAIIQDLQRAMLEADVKVDLVFEMTENIKKAAMNTTLQKAKRKDFVIKLVHDELIRVLGGKKAPIRIKPGKKNVILLVGIQGSGKTTTVGKLAYHFKSKGFKVAALTTDTWRPGAYDQLVQLTKQIGVETYGNPNENNALKIAVKETKKAINDGNDIVIVDTAGRHKEEKELIEEMKKIEAALKPNEVILVIDGTLGQQAFNQAQEFANATNIGSIIVTKLDGTAKGGGALSACAATKTFIRFTGMGEKIEELEEFDPTGFVGSLLGIANLEALVKKVQDSEAMADPELQKRMLHGKFTLDDLCTLLKNMKKLGKMKNILGMMGAGNIPDALKDDAEKNIQKWEVILNSLTQQEKDNPLIIKKERKRRIHRGAGVEYAEINRMLDQYKQMKKMMKSFGKMAKKGKGGKGPFPGKGLPPGFGGKGLGDLFKKFGG
ncbi:MAG: signal recognition particle protein [Candidatus Lokiarchaeota archaeon]|nr:signal recognition particle protein [Candidatus Lokiarchaeota archaeon]